MAAKRPVRRARNPWKRRLKRVLWFLSFTFLVALSVGLAVYIPIYQEASDDAGNIESRLVVGDSNPSVIWSADGKQLYSVAAVRRKVIDLFDPKYPAYIRYALVAAEDRRFFDHKGVDPMGLARAVYRRGAAGGGSTISMQLAKNLVNGDDRSLRRKLKDIATAQQIESLKSKPEILNLYANSTYFGQHAFGIERAAQIYFGKHAEKLTVGEAALLARCVRLPSRVNPVRSLQKMLPLRDYVLGVMKDEGWITQREYDEGIHEAPKIQRNRVQPDAWILPTAGYFVRHVLAQIKADLPDIDLETGGYTIRTSLNYALQKRAVAAVNGVLADNRGHNVNDGAVVVMDGDGRILCEVGGPDYKKRQYNAITQGMRQPGSAFKAIVYAVAMKNKVVAPGSYLSNARIHKKLSNGHYWDPQNASRKENAPGYTLETAFALSVNRPAINTLIKTGVENVIAGAHDIFGIQSHLGKDDSLALGTSEVKPLEMLEAYSVFMLGGDRAESQPIVSVTGPHDEPGKPLHAYAPVVHRGGSRQGHRPADGRGDEDARRLRHRDLRPGRPERARQDRDHQRREGRLVLRLLRRPRGRRLGGQLGGPQRPELRPADEQQRVRRHGHGEDLDRRDAGGARSGPREGRPHRARHDRRRVGGDRGGQADPRPRGRGGAPRSRRPTGHAQGAGDHRALARRPALPHRRAAPHRPRRREDRPARRSSGGHRTPGRSAQRRA